MLKNTMCVYFHSCNNNDVRFIFIHATWPSNVHCTLEKEKYFKIRLAHWRTFVYSILYVYVCVCVYGRYVCHMYECGTSRVGCMHAHVKVIQSSLEWPEICVYHTVEHSRPFSRSLVFCVQPTLLRKSLLVYQNGKENVQSIQRHHFFKPEAKSTTEDHLNWPV